MSNDHTTPQPQCEEALHEIYHLLSGEIDDTKRAKISAHLDECAPCAEPYDFYAELRRCVQQRCHDTAPPELLSRIQAVIQREPS
jgi:mycothiol system anti-sigma-R factor